jgi:multicomponent Na+:H+ antiporter subunit B
MASLILHMATRLLMPLLLMFSLFLLVRGHNQPGGGFTAGLVAAAAWGLYALAYDGRAARKALRIRPRMLIGLGLSSILISGLFGLFSGDPFLTGKWAKIYFGKIGSFDMGTPLLFDFGVYLAVIGVTLTIIFALEEE